MARTLKVLGQIKSAVATLETLYTVPASTSTVVSTLLVCNQSATATSFRVAIRPAGAAIDPKHYLYYDIALAGNDSFACTLGFSLATTDVVSVYATLGTLSFSLFGQENTEWHKVQRELTS